MATDVVSDSREAHKKVKKVLISQPEPASSNSPYFSLSEKFNLKMDFFKFIQVESVPLKEFRKDKVDVLSHGAVIFTSRNAVDNYFRICSESKVEVPVDMKYFCVSEQTAHYLQKYITIRKRKLFVGKRTALDLGEVILKHKDEKFLYPCSDIRTDGLPKLLRDNDIEFTEAVLYRTVSSDLSGVDITEYDLIAFFSPSGVASLKHNFPQFIQGDTRIAAFGPTTSKAVRDEGFILDVEAPLPNAPSMTGALELYIKEVNKK